MDVKTGDWIEMLASQAGPAPRAVVARRLGPALAMGMALALVLATGWPWRPWSAGSAGPVLALKLGYTGLVLLAAAALAGQLARPFGVAVARGRTLSAPRAAWAGLAGPGGMAARVAALVAALVAGLLTMALLAWWSVRGQAPGAWSAWNTWSAFAGGGTASVCAWSITGLSLPTLAAGFWALRGLAPTRLRWAGAAVGLAAGGAGALAYGVVCPETSTAFIALWYTVAMAVPAALGALLGPRLLRW